MNFVAPDFLPALPEIVLLTAICVVLLIDVFLKDEHRAVTYRLSQLSLIVTAICTWALHGGDTTVTFNGHYVADAMGDVLKMFIYLTGIGIFIYSKDYLKARGLFKGEFYVIALVGILGMMIMVSAHSMLSLYLGLEVLSLSMYSMIALDRDNGRASESAIKYFVLGALASGMLLYGMSMIYGATGTLDIAEIASKIAAADGENGLVLRFGMVFLIVGVGFKLGAVPFHMWLPDIYEGSATIVTMYVGSISKIAAFAMVMRLMAEGLGGLQAQWAELFSVLAVLSLIVGNVIAIVQTNIKRMFAYSTISHVGFILLGLLAGTPEGYASAMFYTVVYAITAMGGFAVLVLMSNHGVDAETLDDMKGLNQRSPWLAFMMLLLIFSMAGVPPTVGFYAKLAVLQAIVNAGMVSLAITAVVFSVIGAFYYLRVVKLMYFDDPQDGAVDLKNGFDSQFAISVNGLSMLGLGLFPAGLMAICLQALS